MNGCETKEHPMENKPICEKCHTPLTLKRT
jgi:hypothetical protein